MISFHFCWPERDASVRENKIKREKAKLWRSPVHLFTGTTVTSPAVSERPVWQPHFLHYIWRTHTHTALFYLSGCCLLAIWPGSLCLSACPPHKPNNATLLRLLRTWPAAQWKKRRRRRTPGGGRGKWGKEKVTHSLTEATTLKWESGL